MPAPFYLATKGTTAGTPGTGAFTPNLASASLRAWSTVPAGWIGMVRFEDGAAWELSWSYWNGTTLSRGANQRFDSSTGALLSLTSAATAAMVVDPSEVQPHIGGTRWMHWSPSNTGNTINGIGGSPSLVATGTQGTNTLASTSYLTRQIRNNTASLLTANAQAGYSIGTAQAIVSHTAGMGGWEISCRCGPSNLPTAPRLFHGFSSATFVGQTIEPSARVASMAIFGKDSTDTNIQLMTNDGTSTATKIDTGIPLAVDAWYEMSIWQEPGQNRVHGLLIRLDNGAIWYGSTTTDVPADNALLLPMLLGGLSAASTVYTMCWGSITIRVGS